MRYLWRPLTALTLSLSVMLLASTAFWALGLGSTTTTLPLGQQRSLHLTTTGPSPDLLVILWRIDGQIGRKLAALHLPALAVVGVALLVEYRVRRKADARD